METYRQSDILALGKKANFCVIKYFNQYAEGITGSNRSLTIYTNGGVGFPTKKAAREFFLDKKRNSPGSYKNVKGTPGPYGNVGCCEYQIKFLNVEELKQYLDVYSYYSTNYR